MKHIIIKQPVIGVVKRDFAPSLFSKYKFSIRTSLFGFPLVFLHGTERQHVSQSAGVSPYRLNFMPQFSLVRKYLMAGLERYVLGDGTSSILFPGKEAGISQIVIPSGWRQESSEQLLPNIRKSSAREKSRVLLHAELKEAAFFSLSTTGHGIYVTNNRLNEVVFINASTWQKALWKDYKAISLWKANRILIAGGRFEYMQVAGNVQSFSAPNQVFLFRTINFPGFLSDGKGVGRQAGSDVWAGNPPGKTTFKHREALHLTRLALGFREAAAVQETGFGTVGLGFQLRHERQENRSLDLAMRRLSVQEARQMAGLPTAGRPDPAAQAATGSPSVRTVGYQYADSLIFRENKKPGQDQEPSIHSEKPAEMVENRTVVRAYFEGKNNIPGVDIKSLTDQVYQELERRLRLEKARKGR